MREIFWKRKIEKLMKMLFLLDQKGPREKTRGKLDKSMISGPTNFQHIQARVTLYIDYKCKKYVEKYEMCNSVKGASLQGGIISKENKNNLKDQELKKLLIDMSLIDGENEFTKIMKNKKGLALL